MTLRAKPYKLSSLNLEKHGNTRIDQEQKERREIGNRSFKKRDDLVYEYEWPLGCEENENLPLTACIYASRVCRWFFDST